MFAYQKQTKENRIMSIMTTHLLELVHMDFLTIESGKTDKDVNILIVPDHFMQYAQAFITPLLCKAMLVYCAILLEFSRGILSHKLLIISHAL